MGKPTLKSSISVTFNPYHEQIEREEDDETEEDDDDDVDYGYCEKEYITGNPSNKVDRTLTNRDFMAEKERYIRKKSPEASRFQTNATPPPVNRTSNYLRNETYPREIYATQRRSKTVTSNVTKSEHDNCDTENTE